MAKSTHVVAGPPGTGKTTYLKNTSNQYIDQGARVCFISHTRVAAKELAERIGRADNIHTSTIHSLVYGALGVTNTQVVTTEKLVSFGEQIGVPISGEFDITAEQERTIEEGDEAMAIISRATAMLRDPMEEYEMSNRPLPKDTFEYVWRSYVAWKEANGLVDFTDMLVMSMKEHIPFKYDILIVDEAQDLSPAQWEVVKRLSENVQHVIVAGDPDQALFCWGGADPQGMEKYAEYSGASWHVLPQSYRIPQEVHKTALSIRNRIKNKRDIRYRPREEKGMVSFSVSPSEIQYDKDSLVLYRTHALRREIENDLMEREIPYVTLNGYRSPWQGKYGMLVKAYKCLQEGQPVSTKQKRLLDQHMRTTDTKVPWKYALDIPMRVANYLEATEGKEPLVRLSTIHGAKGMEADKVVLYTGLTQRVLDGMLLDPDPEHRVFYVGVTRAKEELVILQGDNGYDIW